MVHGRPAVVVDLLPREPGRPRTARVTHDPPCRACERRLQYEVPRRRWRCPGCHTIYAPASLAAGVQGGGAERPSAPARQPGRDRHPAERGGRGRRAESRDALLETATGAELHALRWALRDAGEGPLSAERCRQAAATLFAAR